MKTELYDILSILSTREINFVLSVSGSSTVASNFLLLKEASEWKTHTIRYKIIDFYIIIVIIID